MLSRFPIFFKVLMIALITLLISIALGMIESKIRERSNLQADVQNDIARSASGAQTLAGPYFVLEYKLKKHTQTEDDKGNIKITESIEGPFTEIISPKDLKIEAKANVETRSRGIYKAMLYNLNSQVSGSFHVPESYGINKPLADIIPISASVQMTLSDARGLRNSPKLTLNNSQIEFEAGTSRSLGNGISAYLSELDFSKAHDLNFSFPLELQGMSALSITPVGKTTKMKLASSWPHPSFTGAYLPRSHVITDKGFSAEWQVSALARNSYMNNSPSAQQPSTQNAATDAVIAAAQELTSVDSFSVNFIEPVNIYQQAERAVKYGIMFIVLLFAAFFLFEMLLKLPIHPMQYLLVGLSMAMFFLLLISLSEHISFLNAYITAGFSCVVLIGVYLTGLLKTRKTAWLFASGIAMLYALLYGVLQSEDNALVMGALVLFGGLATVMLLTRKLDWYNLNAA